MNSEKRQEVVAWGLTEGSMVERTVAAGAVYVTLDDHKKALAKISQLEQQAEEARFNYANNYAASENRAHKAEEELAASRELVRDLSVYGPDNGDGDHTDLWARINESFAKASQESAAEGGRG